MQSLEVRVGILETNVLAHAEEIRDHEARLRTMEAFRSRAMGMVTLGGALGSFAATLIALLFVHH